MDKYIFLDRDGTINVEVDYLHKEKDFIWEIGAKEALIKLKKLGYKIIIITNQSGIARGYYTETEVEKLHQYMQKTLKKYNSNIDAFYYCPHHAQKGIGKYKIDCDCRKPKTGMFLKAAKDFNINFKNSYMIGDKISDLIPALKLKMKPILVRSGHGKTEELNLNDYKIKNKIEIYDNLLDFVNILKGSEE